MQQELAGREPSSRAAFSLSKTGTTGFFSLICGGREHATAHPVKRDLPLCGIERTACIRHANSPRDVAGSVGISRFGLKADSACVVAAGAAFSQPGIADFKRDYARPGRGRFGRGWPQPEALAADAFAWPTAEPADRALRDAGRR